MSTNGNRTQSMAKGALAGLIGGLAGAAAKAAAEKVFLQRTNGHGAPPLLLVERVEAGTSQTLSEPQKPAADDATNWTFGGLAGAAYGVVVEMNPATAAWQGAAFGLALNRLRHGGLPALGLSPPVDSQTPQERYRERATHVVFGVVTELVRRAVRSGL